MTSSHPQSVEERRQSGRSLRQRASRNSHSRWQPDSSRPDPVSLLEEQNSDRLEWLVPVRRQRMMESPFSFYRGSARIMAADLSATEVSGLLVQACGDAHLANFGLFASPERELVFDLNDFDETLRGPWEWDLKRLVASFAIAGRHNELARNDIRSVTDRVVQSYREAMIEFSRKRTIDIWYANLKAKEILAWAKNSKRGQKRVRKTSLKAKTKDHLQALGKLTEVVDGEYRIKSDPPLLSPMRELAQKLGPVDEQVIRESFEAYLKSVPPHVRVLLDHYRPVDFALKVVGVGSVGTRCWTVLLQGRDQDDPLFLQMKEATESVLAQYLRPSPYRNQGRRVVEGQRLLQAANDMFLGWTRTPETGREFYWRQLRDWKGSAVIETMRADDCVRYARLCGWTLARAHARTGDPVAIAGYLGRSDKFDRALTVFAELYADQNERDYDAFLSEIRSGKLEAVSR